MIKSLEGVASTKRKFQDRPSSRKRGNSMSDRYGRQGPDVGSDTIGGGWQYHSPAGSCMVTLPTTQLFPSHFPCGGRDIINNARRGITDAFVGCCISRRYYSRPSSCGVTRVCFSWHMVRRIHVWLTSRILIPSASARLNLM